MRAVHSRAHSLIHIKKPRIGSLDTGIVGARAKNQGENPMRKARSTAVLGLIYAILTMPYSYNVLAADAARGRALYVRHCQSCHAPGIHGKTARTPATREELRAIVEDFGKRAGIEWTTADVDDVMEHLNTMAYRLPGNGKH